MSPGSLYRRDSPSRDAPAAHIHPPQSCRSLLQRFSRARESIQTRWRSASSLDLFRPSLLQRGSHSSVRRRFRRRSSSRREHQKLMNSSRSFSWARYFQPLIREKRLLAATTFFNKFHDYIFAVTISLRSIWSNPKSNSGNILCTNFVIWTRNCVNLIYFA